MILHSRLFHMGTTKPGAGRLVPVFITRWPSLKLIAGVNQPVVGIGWPLMTSVAGAPPVNCIADRSQSAGCGRRVAATADDEAHSR